MNSSTPSIPISLKSPDQEAEAEFLFSCECGTASILPPLLCLASFPTAILQRGYQVAAERNLARFVRLLFCALEIGIDVENLNEKKMFLTQTGIENINRFTTYKLQTFHFWQTDQISTTTQKIVETAIKTRQILILEAFLNSRWYPSEPEIDQLTNISFNLGQQAQQNRDFVHVCQSGDITKAIMMLTAVEDVTLCNGYKTAAANQHILLTNILYLARIKWSYRESLRMRYCSSTTTNAEWTEWLAKKTRKQTFERRHMTSLDLTVIEHALDTNGGEILDFYIKTLKWHPTCAQRKRMTNSLRRLSPCFLTICCSCIAEICRDPCLCCLLLADADDD